MKRTYTEMVVTPDTAKLWLEKNNPKNRKINFERVYTYANDMKNGNWDITGDGICFDEQGVLLNGQHRLSAVVCSNTPALFLICTGMPRSINYDSGRKRTIKDNIKMFVGADYSTKLIAVASLAMHIIDDKTSGSNVSYIDNYKWIVKHYDSFVNLGLLTTKAGFESSASIMLAMVSAYESGVDIDTISRWRKLIATGESDGSRDFVVIRFRNWIIKNKKLYHINKNMAKEVCKAAQYNIQNFVNCEDAKRIITPDNFIYEIN